MFCTVQRRTKKICVFPLQNYSLATPISVSLVQRIYRESIAVLPLQMKTRSTHVQKPLTQDEHQKQPQKGSSNIIIQKRASCSHAVLPTNFEIQDDARLLYSSFSESAEGTPGFCAVQLHRLVWSAVVGWMDDLLPCAKVTTPCCSSGAWRPQLDKISLPVPAFFQT